MDRISRCNDYEILKTIRHAIYGKVVLAMYIPNNTPVAIKVMKKKYIRKRVRARGGGLVQEDAQKEITYLRLVLSVSFTVGFSHKLCTGH